MSEWGDEVESTEPLLNLGQQGRVLKHNEALREGLIYSVADIKSGIKEGDMVYAAQCWQELTEDEQTAIYIAPKFGGIFTTNERKIIKEGFKDE
jgi:hypothetical protein